MKRDFRSKTPAFHLLAVVIFIFGAVLTVHGITANPYEAIVGRNVFGLKPTPTNAPPPPPPAAANNFKLQGITTILGRPQVLFKVTTAARPPEPAKEKSYVKSEGQGEDDIEVLEINTVAGTVKIKNRDTILSLDMKIDAEKPAVGAALPGPVTPNLQLPAAPGVAAPATTGIAPPNSGEATTVSGSGRTIPTRSLRTSANSGAGMDARIAAGQRSVEENVALYEINRAKNEALIQSGVKLPRMPPHVTLKPPE